MIGLEKVRKVLKVGFHLLQVLVVFSGVSTLVLVLVLYLRSNSLVPVSLSSLVPVIVICILSVANGYLGFNSVNSEKKTKIFLFILTIAAIMNFQIILAVRSNRIVENREAWINSRWESFTDVQREYVQRKFRCCGLETVADRTTKSCVFRKPCSEVFESISKTVRRFVQRSLIYMFFVESMSLTILAFLKFIN